jgi:DNA-binding transcriptional MerR regulator
MSDRDKGAQGQLFSDAAVGAPRYDEVDTDAVGYRGPTACSAAGITYRQLDYWARTGLVAPSVRTATGSGTQRLYSFRDILVLKVVKRLLDTGVSLQNIRKAVDHLRSRGVSELANVTLLSDGASVYECTSAEEVVDLLAGGQGVFGIAVSGALRELSGELAELPAERLDGDGHPVDDELTARRRRRAAAAASHDEAITPHFRPAAASDEAEMARAMPAQPQCSSSA